MSGGAYDHVHGRVDEFANLLTRGVTWDGHRVHQPHPLRLEFAAHLRLVAAAMEAIEMVDSYDASSPHDVHAIEAVLARPIQAVPIEPKPRKPMTWNRDEADMDVVEPTGTADLDRNALLEHALLTLAIGHTPSPSGKRRLTRTELQELARGLCNKLGIDWSGLSRVGVDLRSCDVARPAL